MICAVCKEAVADGARYCENCGARVADKEPGAAPGAALVQAQRAPSAPQKDGDPRARSQMFHKGAGCPQYAPLTAAQCVGILLAFCVPVLNLVLMVKWAYARHGNENRRSLARAGLLLAGAAIGLAILGLALFTVGVRLGLISVVGVI